MFLRELGIHVNEAVVRAVVTARETRSPLYELYATGKRIDGSPRLPICGKGTADKIRKLYENGVLQPFLEYLERGEKPVAQDGEALPPMAESLGPVEQLEVSDYKREAGDEFPLNTGFDNLDQLLVGGIRRGALTILAGATSVGKSTLALNIAMQMAGQGGQIGYIDLATPSRQLGIRMLSNLANVHPYRLEQHLLGDEELGRVTSAVGNLHVEFCLADPVVTSPHKISSFAHQLMEERGLELLVVDYLQLVDLGGQAQGLADFIRDLKLMAMDLSVAILVLSQLDEEAERRLAWRRPRIADLPRNANLAQHADVVMLLQRESVHISEREWHEIHPGTTYSREHAELIVAKNRHGHAGTIDFRFVEGLLRFENYPQKML